MIFRLFYTLKRKDNWHFFQAKTYLWLLIFQLVISTKRKCLCILGVGSILGLILREDWLTIQQMRSWVTKVERVAKEKDLRTKVPGRPNEG